MSTKDLKPGPNKRRRTHASGRRLRKSARVNPSEEVWGEAKGEGESAHHEGHAVGDVHAASAPVPREVWVHAGNLAVVVDNRKGQEPDDESRDDGIRELVWNLRLETTSPGPQDIEDSAAALFLAEENEVSADDEAKQCKKRRGGVALEALLKAGVADELAVALLSMRLRHLVLSVGQGGRKL